ncbi:unnamed protein product [Boreogadus saida]
MTEACAREVTTPLFPCPEAARHFVHLLPAASDFNLLSFFQSYQATFGNLLVIDYECGRSMNRVLEEKGIVTPGAELPVLPPRSPRRRLPDCRRDPPQRTCQLWRQFISRSPRDTKQHPDSRKSVIFIICPHWGTMSSVPCRHFLQHTYKQWSLHSPLRQFVVGG